MSESDYTEDSGEYEEDEAPISEENNVFLLFGSPGVGKTALLEKIAKRLSTETDARLKGFLVKRVRYSKKVRANVGWDVHNLEGDFIPFARTYDTPELRTIGDCAVDTPAFDKIALPAISVDHDAQSIPRTVYLIDGIAELELQSYNYIRALLDVVESGHIVVATVRTAPTHSVTYRRVLRELAGFAGVNTFTVSKLNREQMADILFEKVRFFCSDVDKEIADDFVFEDVALRSDPISDGSLREGRDIPSLTAVHDLRVDLRGSATVEEGLKARLFLGNYVPKNRPQDIHVQWLRDGNAVPENMNNLVYNITEHDLGSEISVEAYQVTPEGVPCSTTARASVGPVKAALPMVRGLQMVGQPVVGQELKVDYAHPGASKVEWWRILTADTVLVGEGPTYTVEQDDFGFPIRATVTALDSSGEPGRQAIVNSKKTTANECHLQMTVHESKDIYLAKPRDTYVEVKYLKRHAKTNDIPVSFRTKNHHYEGGELYWNESFLYLLPVSQEEADYDIVEVVLWNRERHGEDVIIGKGQTEVQHLGLEYNITNPKWVDIKHEGRPAGQILLNSIIHPRPVGTYDHHRALLGPRPGTIKDLKLIGHPCVANTLVAQYFCLSPTTHCWYRTNEEGEETELLGEKANELTLAMDDLNHYIKCRVLELGPKNNIIGEDEVELAIPVEGARPKVLDAELVGKLEESEMLSAEVSVDYFGTHGGDPPYTIHWTRDGEPVPEADGELQYTTSWEDVGKEVAFTFTPINGLNQVGDPVTCRTAGTITALLPEVHDAEVRNVFCGMPMTINYSYKGGIEGGSTFTWLRSEDGLNWTTHYRNERNMNVNLLKIRLNEGEINNPNFPDSDPQVKFLYQGNEQVSTVKNDTNNPYWNEKFDFKLGSGPKEQMTMAILVRDKDGVEALTMGSGSLFLDQGLLTNILGGGTVARTVTLKDEDYNVVGHVNLDLSSSKDDSSDDAGIYWASADDLNHFFKVKIQPIMINGTYGEAIETQPVKCKLNSKDKEVLRSMVYDGTTDLTFNTLEGEGENASETMYKMTMEHKYIYTAENVPGARKQPKPVKTKWAVSGSAIEVKTEPGEKYTGMTMNLPPIGTKKFTPEDNSSKGGSLAIGALAVRCYQGMSLENVCMDLGGKPLWDEWRKGHFAKYAKKRSGGGSLRKDPVKQRWDDFLARPGLATHFPMTPDELTDMRDAKSKFGPNGYRAREALQALQADASNSIDH